MTAALVPAGGPPWAALREEIARGAFDALDDAQKRGRVLLAVATGEAMEAEAGRLARVAIENMANVAKLIAAIDLAAKEIARLEAANAALRATAAESGAAAADGTGTGPGVEIAIGGTSGGETVH